MALHGEVKVNGHTILKWQAQRLTTHDHTNLNEYSWEVAYPEIGMKYSGTLYHDYKDGASVLAIGVLSAGEVAATKLPCGCSRLTVCNDHVVKED